MIYEVWYTDRGADQSFKIYEPGNSSRILISPRLQMSINEPGSFTCTIPETNFIYTHLKLCSSTIDICEGGQVIWSGRPVEMIYDYKRRIKLTCEGALAFFNDTIIPKETYEDKSINYILEQIVDVHNSNYGSIHSRRFFVGTCSNFGSSVTSEPDYVTSMDAIEDLIDQVGGYLLLSKASVGDCETRIRYLKKDAFPENNQVARFGKSLLDFARGYDFTNVYTEVIPVCHNDEHVYTLDGFENDEDGRTYAHDFIDDLNSNKNIRPVYGADGHVGIRNLSWYAMFGRRTRTLDVDLIGTIEDTSYFAEWDDPTEEEQEEYDELVAQNRTNLGQTRELMYNQASKAFDRTTFGEPVFEAKVSDLKLLPDAPADLDYIRLGTIVTVIGNEDQFSEPVTSIDISLDSGVKQVTIGTPEEQDISAIYTI